MNAAVPPIWCCCRWPGDAMTCNSNLAAGTGQCAIPSIPTGDSVTFYAAGAPARPRPQMARSALAGVAVTAADNSPA
ncbi:MAG: hypothetical protein R2856_06870 [Caldilineaceae bacterium]